MSDYILKSSENSKLNHQNLYEGLNEQQAEAVRFNEGPLLVIAGAGSGKTKTLVHRVARLVQDGVAPQEILLLTFTRKASDEMLKRATRILDNRCKRVAGGTFHSFANVILRHHADELGFKDQFTILDRADAENIVQVIRKSLNLHKAEQRFPKKKAVLDLISKSINTGKDLSHILEQDYPHFVQFLEDIKTIASHYQQYKKDRSVMDYDDLLVYLLELLVKKNQEKDPVGASFKYILVDEYQDTNHIQAAIIKELTHTHQNIMAVGDDSQSIYSFRGANFKNIMNFPKLFEGTQIIKLEENFRSTQAILDLTNALINQAQEKYTKHLFTQIQSTQKPVYVEAQSENEQSQFICQKILELREEGVPLKNIAILFRSSSQANDLEVELSSRNIQFVKYGGFKFTETAHIKDVLAYLRVLENPQDGLSWQRLLLLIEGIGPKAADTIYQAATANLNQDNLEWLSVFKQKKYIEDLEKLFKMLKACQPNNVLATVERVLAYYEPVLKANYDDFNKRFADLESLKGIADRFENLGDFLTDMALEPPEYSQKDAEPTDLDDETVVLSTIHSAKGLEWHTVFVISLVDGYFPSFRSLNDMAQIEEERRLMYVALTRAKENLFLLKPHLDQPMGAMYGHGGFQFSQLSRFLLEGKLLDLYAETLNLKPEDSGGYDPDQITGRRYYF